MKSPGGGKKDQGMNISYGKNDCMYLNNCVLVPGCLTTKVQVLLQLVVVVTYICAWCWRTAQQSSHLTYISIK